MRVNQLRLWFAAFACVLMCALRRLALAGTELANATCATIRLRQLKIGALVTVSVRRVKVAFASSFPLQRTFSLAHDRLCDATRWRAPPALPSTAEDHPRTDRPPGPPGRPGHASSPPIPCRPLHLAAGPDRL